MDQFEAFSLYVALFILMFAVLKGNCGRVRMKTKTNLGDGNGDPEMIRALRAQGNAIEDVPIVLIGLGALAMQGAPVLLIHIIGCFFFVARVFHATGIGGLKGMGWGRMAGTIMTMLSFLTTLGANLYFAFT